nr:hypothetical protein [Tanacetum cinerariifolium]
LVDGKKVIISESTIRRDLQLEDAEGVDCLPNAAIFEQLTLMGYQETMGDVVAQTRIDGTLYQLTTKVLALETTKTTQAKKIGSLKRRVKKLRRRKRSRTQRLYKVGLLAKVESSEDEDIFGVNDDDVIVEDAEILFDVVDDLKGEEVSSTGRVEKCKPKAAITITAATSRPKAKGIAIHDQEQAPTPTVSSQQSLQVKDKGKGKMVEQEPMKKFSKKDQLMLDEELAFKLHVEEKEEEMIAREKSQKVKEVNIA